MHSPRSKALPSPSVVGQHASSCFHVPNDSMVTAGGDSQTAIGQDRPQVQYPSTSSTTGSAGLVVNYLRKDLVSATDSVTDAVSSLVKELNSGVVYDLCHMITFMYFDEAYKECQLAN